MSSRADRSCLRLWLPLSAFLALMLPSVHVASAQPIYAVVEFACVGSDSDCGDGGRLFSEAVQNRLLAKWHLDVVERALLQQIRKELSIADYVVVSDADMVRFGETLGASRLVTGTFFPSAGEWDVFARVLNVADGAVIASTHASVDGHNAVADAGAMLADDLVTALRSQSSGIVRLEDSEIARLISAADLRLELSDHQRCIPMLQSLLSTHLEPEEQLKVSLLLAEATVDWFAPLGMRVDADCLGADETFPQSIPSNTSVLRDVHAVVDGLADYYSGNPGIADLLYWDGRIQLLRACAIDLAAAGLVSHASSSTYFERRDLLSDAARKLRLSEETSASSRLTADSALWRGVVLKALGDYEGARAAFRIAITSQPASDLAQRAQKCAETLPE